MAEGYQYIYLNKLTLKKDSKKGLEKITQKRDYLSSKEEMTKNILKIKSKSVVLGSIIEKYHQIINNYQKRK